MLVSTYKKQSKKKMFIKLIILITLTISASQALILEDLIAAGTLESTVSHKKIGFYPGSFDPLHLGHEQLAIQPITMGLCDYVLIYPNWGGDSYKNRVDIRFRLDMVFAAFKDHPNVIVTRLSPQEMQSVLTRDKTAQTTDGKIYVEPKYEGSTFIGIIGSDTALAMAKPDAIKARSLFMTGLKIPEKYYNHTLGCLMSLPAESFIVSIRAGETIIELNNQIGDRPIRAVIENEVESDLSSTKTKKEMKEGSPIESMVSPGVAGIIHENGLYRE